MEEQKIEDFKKVRRSIFKHDKWAAYVLGYDDSYIFTPSRLKSSTAETIAKYEYRIESFVKLLYPMFDLKVYKEAYFFFDAYKDSISSFYKENKDHYKGVEDFVTKLYSEDEGCMGMNIIQCVKLSYSTVGTEQKKWIQSLTISYLLSNKKELPGPYIKNKLLLYIVSQSMDGFKDGLLKRDDSTILKINNDVDCITQEIIKEVNSFFTKALLALDVPISIETSTKLIPLEQDWSLLRIDKVYKRGDQVWIFIPYIELTMLSMNRVKLLCGILFSLKYILQKDFWDCHIVGTAVQIFGDFIICDWDNESLICYEYQDSDSRYHATSKNECNLNLMDFYMFEKIECNNEKTPCWDIIIRNEDKKVNFRKCFYENFYAQKIEEVINPSIAKIDLKNEVNLYISWVVYLWVKKIGMISTIEECYNILNESMKN